MDEKKIPVIVLKNKEKTNRYLASQMDFGDWEDPDLDVTLEDVECAFMIWRKDLSVPDYTDVENVKKESDIHKKYMLEKFGDSAIISFDMDEILKIYQPESIEISMGKFQMAKRLNED